MSIVAVSLLATRQVINVSVCFDYPPIPIRSMDWSAVDDDTYDCSYDGEDETGHHWTSSSPVGHGETQAEAIKDLLEQLEESDG